MNTCADLATAISKENSNLISKRDVSDLYSYNLPRALLSSHLFLLPIPKFELRTIAGYIGYRITLIKMKIVNFKSFNIRRCKIIRYLRDLSIKQSTRRIYMAIVKPTLLGAGVTIGI
jgi:hypothetical protein